MKIVYKNLDDNIYIMTPFREDAIMQIAEKDVPAGVRFWILADSEIPIDRSKRYDWFLSLSKGSDGIGLNLEEYKLKYPDHINPGVTE